MSTKQKVLFIITLATLLAAAAFGQDVASAARANKTAKTVSTSAPTQVKKAILTISDNPTWEEFRTWEKATIEAGRGNEHMPSTLAQRNISSTIGRAASKALISLAVGDSDGAEPWIGAANDLSDPASIKETEVVIALRHLQLRLYRENKLGVGFGKDDQCTKELFTQFQMGHFFSEPLSCKTQ